MTKNMVLMICMALLLPGSASAMAYCTWSYPGCITILMSVAHAAEDDDDEEMQIATQPQVHQSRYAPDVTYVIGGIGEEYGKEYIESIQHQYDLKLIFSTKDGRYLSNVAVVLEDKTHNALIDVVAEGPFVLINLPAGTYTLRTSYEGVTKRKDLAVQAHKLKTLHVYFEEAGEE